MDNDNDAVSPPASDDFTVVITPLDAVKPEGNSGVTPFTPFTFTMTLVGDASVARDIFWKVNLSGHINYDFYQLNGQVHFAPGETSKDFIVGVLGDTNLEADETFTVTAIATGTSQPFGTPGQGIILADDNGFGIAARTPIVSEGSAEVRNALFEVVRFGDTSWTEVVTWSAIGSGHQHADAADFAGDEVPHGSLTFLPGETSKPISLAIAPDSELEGDEQFEVSISASPWGDSVTIVDDDATVEIRRLEMDTAEGDSGTTSAVFELLLTGDSSQSRSVSWRVTPQDPSWPPSFGFSAEGTDFEGGEFPVGTVIFSPGETRVTVSVPIAGDALSETDEWYTITLFDPSPGLTLGLASSSFAGIRNDDPLPVRTHDDAYVTTEGAWVVAEPWRNMPGALANDIGAEAVALGIGPSHGSLELKSNGSFTYKPDAGFTGVDSFTYTAAGPDGYDHGRVTIHVTPMVLGQTKTLDLLALTPEEQVAATYIAFAGRAADSEGFDFWVDEFHAGLPAQGPTALLANIASSFAISDEAKGLYAFLANPGSASDGEIGDFLDRVYQNLFNRPPDDGGRDYWTGQVRQKLASGEFVGSVLVDIMSGAQYQPSGLVLNGNRLDVVHGYNDLGTLMAKVAVSLEFVRTQQEHGMAWNGPADIAAATDLLTAVYVAEHSILLGIREGEVYVAQHG